MTESLLKNIPADILRAVAHSLGISKSGEKGDLIRRLSACKKPVSIAIRVQITPEDSEALTVLGDTKPKMPKDPKKKKEEKKNPPSKPKEKKKPEDNKA